MSFDVKCWSVYRDQREFPEAPWVVEHSTFDSDPPEHWQIHHLFGSFPTWDEAMQALAIYGHIGGCWTLSDLTTTTDRKGKHDGNPD